jgi:hypothetical protein
MPDFQGSRENGFINTVIFFSVELLNAKFIVLSSAGAAEANPPP